MSNLTRKLWKVCDAVEIKEQTTTKEVSMKDELMKLLRTKASLVAFVGIVMVLIFGSWLGL